MTCKGINYVHITVVRLQ